LKNFCDSEAIQEYNSISVLFNLFVIVEPLVYLRVFHGNPINKT